MTNLKNLVLVVPARPIRTYFCGSGPYAVKTTNQITLGMVNIPMVVNIDYQDTMDEYLSKKRRYENQLENWDENDAKGYYLVLQNCPKELEADLRNQNSWKTEEYVRSVIAVLLLIRDLSFNKTYRKRSIMATVEADAGLYIGMKRLDQSTNKFYMTFTAQVDTINVNGGSAGFQQRCVQQTHVGPLEQEPFHRQLA